MVHGRNVALLVDTSDSCFGFGRHTQFIQDLMVRLLFLPLILFSIMVMPSLTFVGLFLYMWALLVGKLDFCFGF